jgi:ribosomal protein S27E
MTLLLLISIGMVPVAIFLLDTTYRMWLIGLDILSIVAVLFALFIYFSARKAYKDLHEMHPVEEVGVVQAQAHEHHHQEVHHEHHHPAQQQNMMTVECPQCGNHIQLPEGSHQITCPYCGLSGTL